MFKDTFSKPPATIAKLSHPLPLPLPKLTFKGVRGSNFVRCSCKHAEHLKAIIKLDVSLIESSICLYGFRGILDALKWLIRYLQK